VFCIAASRNSPIRRPDLSPRRVLAALAALLGSLLLAGSAAAAEVARFSPQGTVVQVRQVSAAFSDPMVAFGDPAARGTWSTA